MTAIRGLWRRAQVAEMLGSVWRMRLRARPSRGLAWIRGVHGRAGLDAMARYDSHAGMQALEHDAVF